jgi:hypothetical protein
MEVASTGIQFEELRASYWQRNHHHHPKADAALQPQQ